MTLELEPDLVKAIDELIRSSGYRSPEDVVRAAILLLKSQDRERREEFDRLRAQIQIGIDQIERGEVHDADEVFAELLEGLPAPNPGET